MTHSGQSAPVQNSFHAMVHEMKTLPLDVGAAPRTRERLAAEPLGVTVDLCQDCGACLSRCHLVEGQREMNPRKLLGLVRRGLEGLALGSPFIWSCTLCNRCTLDCPTGVRMDEVVRALRGLCSEDGHAPKALAEGIQRRLEMGSVSGVEPEDYVEHAEWMAEELGAELEDPDISFPMDLKGARYLYLPNPRELTVNPMLFTANTKIMHLLGEPWTLSRRCSDVTNWGYFTGEDHHAREILAQVAEAGPALGVETLVMTECGHGYKSYLQDAERWLGHPLPFQVRLITSLAAEALTTGRLKVDPSANPGLHTYHDPCNLSRKTDMVDPPRRLLDACVERWVEMRPNRQWGWCCGGGGGTDYLPETKVVRDGAGRLKAAQIRATGASVVATGCLSCWSNLQEIVKRNGLEVEVRTMGQILARALVPLRQATH